MNQEEYFAEQLKELREIAEINGGEVTLEDIRAAFDEMELDDEQLGLILKYLKENARIRISEEDDEIKENEEDSRFLKMYFEELKAYPAMTDGKKRALFMAAMNGEKNAKDELLIGLLPQVVDIARLYSGQGVSMEDLIGEGNVALAMSMDVIEQEEDPDEAEKMVAGMIMSAMEEIIDDDLRSSDAFNEWAERANDVFAKAKAMSEELLRKITVEEFCKETGYEKDYVMDVIEVSGHQIHFFDLGNKE